MLQLSCCGGYVMLPFVVIFDMDGLMLDTERMARNAWLQALAEKGFQMEEASYLRLIGRTVQDAEMILGEIFGAGLPFQQVFDQRQTYYDLDIEQNGIPLKSGLIELLNFLEEQGITKAVASSTPCWFAVRKLAHVGVENRFRVVVCGDMVERGKPAPDLFLEAARRLNIQPEQCIVLEDSEAGIQAGHAAGMLPVMVPDLKPPSPEVVPIAYRIIPSLHDVIPLLQDILRDGFPQDARE